MTFANLLRGAIELMAHQRRTAKALVEILEDKKLAYLFGEPRVGKTLTALTAATEFLKKQKNNNDVPILVIAPKRALDSWLQYKDDFFFIATNYEKVSKINQDFSLVIVDEAHNFSNFPKKTQRYTAVRTAVSDKPLILLSGTPFVEGLLRAYTQFSLSARYSPFQHKTAYHFFKNYGIENKIYLNGRMLETYTKAKDDAIRAIIAPYIVRMTRADAGFTATNSDRIIRIKNDDFIKFYNKIKHDRIIEIDKQQFLLDTPSAMYSALLRICGGFYEGHKLPSPKRLWLENALKKSEKSVALMCYYKDEQAYFTEFFAHKQNIKVLSSTKYCESIDLSNYDTFVLYSFGYSGSKFCQLRDRIVNITKNIDRTTHIPLLQLIDSDLYNIVSAKRTFNSRSYEMAQNRDV